MKREELLIEPRELLAKLGDPRLRIYDSTIMFYMGMSAEEAAKLPSAREMYLGGHLPGAAFFDHQLVTDPIGKYEYTVAPDSMLARQIGVISSRPCYATGIPFGKSTLRGASRRKTKSLVSILWLNCEPDQMKKV